MAAYIVRPTEKEWAVLEKILRQCGEGAIIIPPTMQLWLKEQGVKAKAGDLIDYDFGGECDVMIDVMDKTDHHALGALDGEFATWYIDGLRDSVEKPETITHVQHGPSQEWLDKNT